jgi:hypothetical protein
MAAEAAFFASRILEGWMACRGLVGPRWGIGSAGHWACAQRAIAR